MIERDDLDMLAAEFVLGGTLPVEDRQRVQRLRTTHPELDAQILQWESRLSALNDEIEPVDPPAPPGFSPGLSVPLISWSRPRRSTTRWSGSGNKCPGGA